jgi:hypothetical protein
MENVETSFTWPAEMDELLAKLLIDAFQLRVPDRNRPAGAVVALRRRKNVLKT